MTDDLAGKTDELKKKRFFWGVSLAWIPAIPIVISLMVGLRDISTSKATGLGAVAGGFAESYLTLGIGLTIVFEVAAIILLLRAFSQDHIMRSLFSVLSICCSALILVLFGLFVWLFFFKMHHAV